MTLLIMLSLAWSQPSVLPPRPDPAKIPSVLIIGGERWEVIFYMDGTAIYARESKRRAVYFKVNDIGQWVVGKVENPQ